MYVAGRPPKAVLSVGRLPVPVPFRFCTLHATDPSAAESVLSVIPAGAAFFVLTETWQLDLLRERAKLREERPAWLFRLDPTDFVDEQRHEVRPVGTEWAGLIAKWWDPDNPMEPYIRSRLEGGPNGGIYEGDELVV